MRKLLNSLFCVTALALPAAAQQKTMVAIYKVKYDKMPVFVEAYNRSIAPALDRLLADGVIDAYGLDSDVLHGAGQPNVGAWFTASSYGNLQKAEEATLAAIATHPAEAGILLGSSDMEAHQDLLLQTDSSKFGKIPPGAKPFTSIAFFKLKPGKESEWNQVGAKYYKPIYDKLVDDGVIYGYRIETQAMHTQNAGHTWVSIVLPDMSALDKVDAVFADKMKSMTPAERSILQNSERTLTDEAAHRDYLMRSLVFKNK